MERSDPPYNILLILLIYCSLTISCKHNTEINECASSSKEYEDIRKSIYTSPTAARQEIQTKISQTGDSMNIYRLKALYATSFCAEQKFDSATFFNEAVKTFALRQPYSQERNAMLAIAENISGNICSYQIRMDSALLHYQQAYQYAQQAGEWLAGMLPDIYINLADVNIRSGKYPEAASYFRQALHLCDSSGKTSQLSAIYIGLGQSYMELRNFPLAEEYYNKAEKLENEMTRAERFLFHNNRGNLYYFKQDYQTALNCFLKAFNVAKSDNHYEFNQHLTEINLSEIYLLLDQPDSAVITLGRCYPYFLKLGYESILYHLASLRLELALKQNNQSEADKILKETASYRSGEPNLENIRNRYMQHYYITKGNYRKAYDLLKTYHHQEDSLRNERIQLRVEEIDMRYKQDTTLMRREEIIARQHAEMKELKTSFIFSTALLIVFILLAAIIILYMKKQRSLQWMKYVNQITKLRMQSIHNRIFPHFTFNVLGRITSEFDPEDERKAELSELIKLLRKSLELTERISITLEEELSFVKSYIYLESKSLGNDFIMEWDLDNTIHYTLYYVPSLILQIPVENAIKHALRTKPGEKKLRIRIHKEEEGIQINIIDNGLGLNVPPQNTGTGTGFKVLYGAIQLLNSKNKKKITLSIHLHTSGVGTDVSLFIPEKYEYKL